MHWKRAYYFLQVWLWARRWPYSSLQSPGPRLGSESGSMLVELPKTCGSKVRRQLKLLLIEEWSISKQAKRKQERRYKQLPIQSRSCGSLPEPQCRHKRAEALLSVQPVKGDCHQP